MIDVFLQEVRCIEHGSRMLGMKGRKYKLWWSGIGDGVGGMVKDELCEQVVDVSRVSDRVMAVVLVFEEDVLRLICGYAPQSVRKMVYL